MVHVLKFDSTEEMVEHLRGQAERALHSLSDQQRSLTWGSHWVQFHDIDNGHLIWGHVLTAEQAALGELRGGADWSEVLTSITDIENRLNDGFMYGMAYDRFNAEGELGTTHKAHVWPVEESTFEAAQAVGWDHRQITDERARFGLDLAFRSMRAHLLPRTEDQS